ncbi:MAG TPA: GerMN domain-containing protein [Candidatus Limnocylindria bacterium]|nr:GerMN domain-containing protein [Candidatus Limnocylindria bacterium]
MTRARRALAAALLIAVGALSGCASSVPVRQGAGPTLPPPREEFPAPVGDAAEGFAQTVLVALVSVQTGQLAMFPERILLSPGRHPAEFALRRLFSFAPTTQALPVAPEGTLALSPGSAVEVSGDTATVNLGPGALSLSAAQRATAFRAIAATLTQWGDIRYVNVLISGRQPGLDTASTLPTGSFTGGLEDSAAGDAAAARAAGAGRGLLAEGRTVTFPSASIPDMAAALMGALSAGALTLPGLPRVPDLATLLAGPPEVEENPGGGGRVVRLRFHESANDALITARIPRSVMMASLAYTLTTFLPYVGGVAVQIGSERITAVVPSGTYEGAGDEILFQGGVMARSQFSHFLLSPCALYFADGTGALRASYRAIPWFQAYNPRFLLGQLMAGPMNTDSVPGLMPTLPAGLTDADLLGVSRAGDAVLVNFSQRLRELARGQDGAAERRMVYSAVNTLTSRRGVTRVFFFIGGSRDGVFSEAIDVAGQFLRAEGLVQ